jgi:putative ABC transport system ATP-binding protein
MSEGPGDDLLVVEDVSRSFGSVQALDRVNLRVARGTVVAVRGDSGSGKTTLLGLIGGLDTPDSGRVVVDGEDLASLSERELVRYRAHKVGFVFQSYHLVPWLSAQDNVEFGMEPTGIPLWESRERASELLDLTGLSARAHHRPSQLSGGEQQRVGIARALAKRPRLILADEPTGNLDRHARKIVIDYLLRAARTSGTTALIVTHDPGVADRCDVVHKLKDGRITKQGRLRRRPDTATEPADSAG